jgi:hypothetical protein
MEYRGVEYTVVQGIERGVWKWSVSLGDPAGPSSWKSVSAFATFCPWTIRGFRLKSKIV